MLVINFLPCCTHGGSRICEKIYHLVICRVHQMDGRGYTDYKNRLKKLVENINTLKGAGTPFKIYYDKNTNAVERPSFNGILARRLLIAPKETENFVMYGVLCSKETIEVPALLLELLNSDMTKNQKDFPNIAIKQTMSDLTLHHLLFYFISEMNSLLRKDIVIKESQDLLKVYNHNAEVFYQLMKLLYGTSELTPYMLIYIDIMTELMEHHEISIIRGATEGSESLHNLFKCLYYMHSNKGGRSQKNPLIGLLFGQFRRLLNKIEDVLTEHDWQIKSTGTSDELLIPKFNEFYTGAIQDFAARKIQRWFRTY